MGGCGQEDSPSVRACVLAGLLAGWRGAAVRASKRTDDDVVSSGRLPGWSARALKMPDEQHPTRAADVNLNCGGDNKRPSRS
jgi:hypothetical protein